MKKLVLGVFSLFLLFVIIAPLHADTDPAANKEIRDLVKKIDGLVKKQDEISKQLEEIKQELYIIKIRVSSGG